MKFWLDLAYISIISEIGASLEPKPIPEEVIDEAIAAGRIMYCAGAMRCEDKPFSDYIERFDGTKDSTSGLPLNLLEQLMEKVKT